MDEQRMEMMRLLRRMQAAGKELSSTEQLLLGGLENEYVARVIYPVLRDRVSPLVEGYGAPLVVTVEADAAGNVVCGCSQPDSASQLAVIERMQTAVDEMNAKEQARFAELANEYHASQQAEIERMQTAADEMNAEEQARIAELANEYSASQQAEIEQMQTAADEMNAEEQAPEQASEQASEPAAAKPRRRQGQRFRFSAIGLKPGDMVTFRPTGLQVRVAADNQVEYMGRSYLLSTFTKEFMPEKRRIKSGAYQGAHFFSYGGVKLTDLWHPKKNNKRPRGEK